MAKATRTGDDSQENNLNRSIEERLKLQRELSQESEDQISLAEKMEKKLQKLSLEYAKMSSRLEAMSKGYVSISDAQEKLQKKQIDHYTVTQLLTRRAIDNEKLILSQKKESIKLSNEIIKEEQRRAPAIEAVNQMAMASERELLETKNKIASKEQALTRVKSRNERTRLAQEISALKYSETQLLQKYEILSKTAEEEKKSLDSKIEAMKAEKQSFDQSVKNLQAQIRYDEASSRESKKKIELARESLTVEQQVSRQLGISGQFSQKLAQKLGVGKEFQEKMSEGARKLVESKNNLVSLEKELIDNELQQASVKEKILSSTGEQKELYEAELESLQKQNFAMQRAVKYNELVASKTKPIVGAFASIAKNAIESLKGMTRLSGAAGVLGLAIKAASAVGDKLGEALSLAGTKMKGLSQDSSNFFSGLTSGISGMLKNIPIVGGFMAGLVDFASSFLDLIIGVDDYIVRTGRQLGLTAEKSRTLKDNFANVAASSEKTYVTTKAIVESFASMAKVTGLNNSYTQEMLETNIELTKYAGLQAETTAELANVSRITGNTMKGITKDVLAQTVALEQTTGIAFNYQQVLSEATGLSGRLGLSFAKYPKELTKSLLVVKAMGLDLKELNNMASSFLDFESSISKEFEAQLLTGKDINLAKARELFMTNDLAGAAAEITRQVGDSNSFMKMNRFQQDSLAESMGMTADQMADMLKKQELFTKFRVSDQKSLLKQIDLMRSQNREAEIRAKFQDEEAYQSMVNLSLQDKLATSFEKIKQSLVDFLTQKNVIDKIEGFVKYLSDPKKIQNIVENVKGYIVKIMDFVGGSISLILEAVGNIANFFTFGEKGDRIERQFDEYAEKIRNFSSTISENVKKTGDFSTKEEKEKTKEKSINVKDAVVFPEKNLIVNKDPLDYTIFVKDPSKLFQSPVESKQQISGISKDGVISLDQFSRKFTEVSSMLSENVKSTAAFLSKVAQQKIESRKEVEIQPKNNFAIDSEGRQQKIEVSKQLDAYSTKIEGIFYSLNENLKSAISSSLYIKQEKTENQLKLDDYNVKINDLFAIFSDRLKGVLNEFVVKQENVLPIEGYASSINDAISSFNDSIKDTLVSNVGKEKREETDDSSRVQSVNFSKETIDFLNNNSTLNRDTLNYEIVNKNEKPVQQSPIDVNAIISAITTAIRQQPVNVNLKTDLSVQGEPIARVNYTATKNNVVLGFDRQSGPMSLNS